jgi:hypothetical protein
MSPQKSVRKRIVVGLFTVALAGGIVAMFVERTPLLAWFTLRSLARAAEQDRAIWVDRTAGLGEGAEPAVFAYLAQTDEAACRNAGAVLERWIAQYGPDDARAAALAERIEKGFGAYSPAGRQVVLEAAALWFAPTAAKPSDALTSACARLVAEAAKSAGPSVHAAGLNLCSLALDRTDDAKVMLDAGRDLVAVALRDEPAANRVRATLLAVRPGMDDLEEVAVLLKDPVAGVRRAALLAVGPADEKVVSAKTLLPVLHDNDPEVRRACEDVLRLDRHLSPQSYQIGWCLYHPDPAQRLNVLDHLRRGADVEPGVWLRELSHDESPAVRLAAVRAMSQQDRVDLRDRLEQMAEGDPSPTVSQMARLYQKWAKAPAGMER